MRKCNQCGHEDTIESFRYRSYANGKPITSKICYTCFRKRSTLWQRNLCKSGKAFIDAIKSQLKCSVCGEDCPAALDFHHANSNKDRSVAALKGFSKQRIVDEMAKCTCVCATCHRKIHGGYLDDKSLPLVDMDSISIEWERKPIGHPILSEMQTFT